MAGKISNQTRVKGIKCKALMHPYRSRDWRSNSWVAQRLHAELQCPVTPPAYHVAAHHCVSLPTVDHVGRRRRTGQNRRPTRSTGNKDKLTDDVVKEYNKFAEHVLRAGEYCVANNSMRFCQRQTQTPRTCKCRYH